MRELSVVYQVPIYKIVEVNLRYIHLPASPCDKIVQVNRLASPAAAQQMLDSKPDGSTVLTEDTAVLLPYRAHLGFHSGDDLFYNHLPIELLFELKPANEVKKPVGTRAPRTAYGITHPRADAAGAKWVQYGRKTNQSTNALKVYYRCVYPGCTAKLTTVS